MNKGKSLKVITPLFLVLFLTFFTGCKNKIDEQDTEAMVQVEVIPVGHGEIAKILRFTGNIEAEAEVTIYPQLTATIREIKAGLGDSVQKGEVIAILESEEFEAQLAQAGAALEAVRAKWAQMEAGARPEEISQAEDQLTKAKAALKEAENNFNRSKDMLERSIISEGQFESSERSYAVARADLGSAMDRLKMLRAGATKEDRDALKAQVRQAEAAVELARIRLSYTRITSPFKGTVSERFFEPGDLAMPGKPLFTLVQMESVKAVIYFQENQIRYLKEGIPASIRIAAYPDEEFKGKIERISPTLNPQTRMFRSEIRLDNTKHMLRPGMFAEIMFSIDPHTNALLVPKEAVVFPEGTIDYSRNRNGKGSPRGHLFVVEGEIAHKREATLGYISGDIVEILEGLKIGDLVITRGLYKLKDGDRVKIAG